MISTGLSQSVFGRRGRMRLFLAALAAVVLAPAAADASFVQIDLNSSVAGATPGKADNSKPYFLRIQLQDGTDMTGSYVLVQFISNLAVPDNQRFDFVTLNLTTNPFPGSATVDSPSPTGVAATPTVSVSNNNINLPGAPGGNFDLEFDFLQSGGQVPNSTALDGTDVFSVKLRAAGVTQNSFLATNVNGTLYAGAHVIGLDGTPPSIAVYTEIPPVTTDGNPDGNPNGNPDPVAVPAPAGLVLGLLGGASLGGLGLRRARRPQVVA